MRYHPDAYEYNADPGLNLAQYVEFPDGSHIICVKAQLLDATGNLSKDFDFDDKRKVFKVAKASEGKKKGEMI